MEVQNRDVGTVRSAISRGKKSQYTRGNDDRRIPDAKQVLPCL